MNEKLFAQAIAELQHAQSEAFALLTQAMCRQLDAKRLKIDLERITQAYLQMPKSNPLAARYLQSAIAAAHSEQMQQGTAPDEGPHPTRAN